jgi:hypothetical protein
MLEHVPKVCRTLLGHRHACPAARHSHMPVRRSSMTRLCTWRC